MSNEELAILIQNGDRSKLAELWDGVRGYVAKTARSYIVLYDGRYGVEFEDLMQSGFLAMVAAAENFEEKDTKFITWLTYHLKTAFAEAANRRTKRQRGNPLHTATSLYAPAPGIDDGETTIQDVIPGPDAFEDVEAKIYREQLRTDLEAVLSTIPATNADVLRMHFFDDLDLTQIAQRRGVSAAAASACKREGLRNMRQKTNTSQGARLRAYIEDGTKYYTGMGFGRFINTQTSPIERVVIERERMAKVFFAPLHVHEWGEYHAGKWKSADHI